MFNLFANNKQPYKKYQPVVSVGDLPTYHIIIDDQTGERTTIDTRTGEVVILSKQNRSSGLYAYKPLTEKYSRTYQTPEYDQLELDPQYTLETLAEYRELYEGRVSRYTEAEDRVAAIDAMTSKLKDQFFSTSEEKTRKKILAELDELSRERDVLSGHVEMFRPSSAEIDQVIQHLEAEAEGLHEQMENDARLIRSKLIELDEFYRVEKLRLNALMGRAVKNFNENVAQELQAVAGQTGKTVKDLKANVLKY